MTDMETMTRRKLDNFQQKAVAMILERFSWDTACHEHARLYLESLCHWGSTYVSG